MYKAALHLKSLLERGLTGALCVFFSHLLMADSTPDVKDFISEASAYLNAGDYPEAQKAARAALHMADKYSSEWLNAGRVLGLANEKIYRNPKIPDANKREYTVQSGDSMSGIAERFGVTKDSIIIGNRLNMKSTPLYPGQKLIIYSGKWDIKVLKSRFRLLLYCDGELFKVYPISTGKEGHRTPAGNFEIASKEVEPNWYHEGKIFYYGKAGHPLGTRWMGLEPGEGTAADISGLGIHGSWHPERIGRAESNGCIRMKNTDVEEIFSIVPYKTKVLIEE